MDIKFRVDFCYYEESKTTVLSCPPLYTSRSRIIKSWDAGLKCICVSNVIDLSTLASEKLFLFLLAPTVYEDILESENHFKKLSRIWYKTLENISRS